MAAPERTARVVRVVDHGGSTRSLFLRPDGPRLDFTPGQFLSLRLPVGGDVLTRPYSIASCPEDDALELCLNAVPGGAGSAYLLGLEVGAPVVFTGPWGTFTLARPADAEAVFVADGTGLAPIRPMLRRALAGPPAHPVRLLHAVAAGAPRLWAGELADLARRHPAFAVTWIAPDALHDTVRARWVDADADRSRRFWICGVGGIVTALRDLLRGAGYARRAVLYEKW
jgi:ferredoxin-NADP reductase